MRSNQAMKNFVGEQESMKLLFLLIVLDTLTVGPNLRVRTQRTRSQI